MTNISNSPETTKNPKKLFCAHTQYAESLMIRGLAKAAELVVNKHFSENRKGSEELAAIIDAMIIGLERHTNAMCIASDDKYKGVAS